MSKTLGHTSFNPYVPFDFKTANDNYVKKVFKDQDPPVGASSRVGIITCCDARSSPDHFFQLSHNQAFIIRNGGGRTSPPDVIRTLASIEILSDIKEVMVIHHTGKRNSLVFTPSSSLDPSTSSLTICIGTIQTVAPCTATTSFSEAQSQRMTRAWKMGPFWTVLSCGRKALLGFRSTGRTGRQRGRYWTGVLWTTYNSSGAIPLWNQESQLQAGSTTEAQALWKRSTAGSRMGAIPSSSNCSRYSWQNEHKSRMSWVREEGISFEAAGIIRVEYVLCNVRKYTHTHCN